MKKLMTVLAAVMSAAIGLPCMATQTVEGDTLTISKEIVTIATESDFGAGISKIVLKDEGGISVSETIWPATKTYSLDGKGVISVAAGKTFDTDSKDRMVMGTLGQTMVKRGPGTLRFNGGPGVVADDKPTRWVVEDGVLLEVGKDFFGGHANTTANLTVDVREGAVFQTDDVHCPMGPLELTGGTMDRRGGTLDAQWGNTAFRGGVLAHASSRDSFILIGGNAHLNHVNTDVPFVVEPGATLNVRGRLSNGYNAAVNARIANKLMVSGGGHLRLFSKSVYTGGTKISSGTTVTVADSEAFGTGGLEIDGEVTLEVLPGVTFVCPSLTGSGTLKKTGAGVAQFTSVAAGVTVERAEGEGTMGAADVVKDGVVHLNGNRVEISVSAGQRLEVVSFADDAAGEGVKTEVVKTGEGTLVLPTGNATKFGRLTIGGGFVEVADEGCFGADGIALQNGGGIRFLNSMNQSRSVITCTGSSTLDVPAGVTLGLHSDFFRTTGATVTKTGAGVWKLNTTFRCDQGATPVDFTGTKWVTHEGKLKFAAGDNFAGHNGSCPLVLEAHEGAVLEANSCSHHLPLCNVVLRGATMFAFYAQFPLDTAALEGAGNWHGFGLNGPITVIPSNDGRPSRICARTCHLAHGTKTTIFDVREGATLEVDSLLDPGWNNGATARNLSGLTKTGAGTLRLLRQVGTQGTFDIREGAVELGPKAALNANLKLAVAPQAKFVMNDGAQLSSVMSLTSALCASADVWFDASQLAVADGAAVGSVRNLGTAGGEFKNVPCINNYTPVAPKFVANGIGGLGCLSFDGSQSLVITAHTNRGSRTQVFIVSRWTRWENRGGFGLYGGPFSMMAKSPKTYTSSGDDDQSNGSLTYNNWSGTITALQTCSKESILGMDPSGIELNTPYLTHSGRDAAKKVFYSEVWTTATLTAKTNSVPALENCDIDAVCVGGRMRLGVPQIWGQDNGNNRQYIGQIGEVLVFSRELSETETSAIYAYLKKKWFGVGTLGDGEIGILASPVEFDVVSDSLAHVAAATAEDDDVRITKSGNGNLRLGGEFAGATKVDVKAGGLVLKDGRMPSQVDIWVDASDSTGMAFDDEGRVTNLVNRGSCGGSFVRNARKSAVPFGPTWSGDGSAAASINGRPALVFDGDSALALFDYVNKTSPRRLSVYCVVERTFWEASVSKGLWASVIAFGRTNSESSDQNIPGIVIIQEGYANGSVSIDTGNSEGARTTAPSTGVPYMMVMNCVSNGCFLAYETESESGRARGASSDMKQEPFDIDLVQLAVRTSPGGGPQWYGKGNANNCTWFGKIGEFIATTEPLSYDQERELFAYLRKKWFNMGDASTTPPAWLSGVPAAPAFGNSTAVAMADGTSLQHEAGAVTLGTLETSGTVDWTRVWGGETSDFPMFTVDGISLATVNLMPIPAVRSKEVKILDYGERDGVPSWKVFRPDGRERPYARVSDINNAFWLNDQVGLILVVQ